MRWTDNILHRSESIAPLVVFRIIFGMMMALSTIRFLMKGWVSELYIQPKFFFTFYGFEWVKPLPGNLMYVVFAAVLLASLMVMIGWHYRVATILFFFSFTYVELIDKTNYLNHYYFISLVGLLLIFLPAHRYFSVDAWRRPSIATSTTPAWTINLIKFQLAVVYIYAGIAKLNADWLLQALPLKIWLPAQSHLPVIGPLLELEWVAYFFSWGGAFFDLFIVLFLLNARTRPFAYLAVVFFHLCTATLFPAIGMFPFIMTLSVFIFFSAPFHEKVIRLLSSLFRLPNTPVSERPPRNISGIRSLLLAAYVTWQVLMPWRYLLYPGPLFWNEEGYRFSWRVMLMEKAGTVAFHVYDPETGRRGQIATYEYLTPQQEKMMATQPDMMLQFAHFLREEAKKRGLKDPEIRAESWVSLNGARSRPFTDPAVDLTKEKESFLAKTWILPFK